MSAPIVTIGSPSDHGGKVISASGSITSDGKQVACLGDMHFCPQTYPNGAPHGVTPIVSDCATTFTSDGKPVAKVGCKAACGATINAGSQSFNVE